MKKFLFSCFLLLLATSACYAQVGINTDNTTPDPSAMLDVKSPDKGLLAPRVALTATNVALPVSAPAVGLQVYNTATSGTTPFNVTPGLYIWNGTQWKPVSAPNGVNTGDMQYWNGTQWVLIPAGVHGQQLFYCNGVPKWGGCTPVLTTNTITNITTTAAVSGGNINQDNSTPVLSRGVCWSIYANPTINDSITTDGSGAGSYVSNVTGLMLNTHYYLRSYAINSYGAGYGNELSFTTRCEPSNISTGADVAFQSQIIWNWNPVDDATGYKWNTTDDYASATDMATATTITETGLTCNTIYTRYVWAYNTCGNSAPVTLTHATLTCGTFSCGQPITVNHVAGVVAPVSKTVGYITVDNIPGENSKCWITSNLGADHQATAVNDDTEASAGWYWQFNRKQGYKHDGTTLTPGWTTNTINESSDWLVSNDPCNLELGANWRLPSYTEWVNVDNSGGWVNWTNPWGSNLKLHAAGRLSNADGLLSNRGSSGNYASSTQSVSTSGWRLYLASTSCSMIASNKAYGFSARCIQDGCIPPSTPTQGTHTRESTQIIWNWNTVTGATGYKWNTTNDYASAADMATVTTKTETGLTCNTAYIRYAWAYNACGNSTPVTLTQTTLACGFICGQTITVNHVAGDVAPVSKSVTYGTVDSIPGEFSKCWITSNLGADHQAAVVYDATEASSGWYWQFNKKQGYKLDGATRTPNTTWISSISESSDWITINDPCTLELGTGWRLPTKTEWINVHTSGSWTNWNGSFGSSLKLHAAGNVVADGSLNGRGSIGLYWSSTQKDATSCWNLYLSSFNCIIYNDIKSDGASIRCVSEY